MGDEDAATGVVQVRTRRSDGDRTRAAITAATVALIAVQGLAGTTQRRVATRAGVSLASVTYHFATLDELFAAAFDRVIDESVTRLDRLRKAASEGRITLAQAWEDVVRGPDGRTREEVVGSFELLVAAIRQPELRPSATRLLDALNSFFLAWTPEPDPSRSVLSLMLGLSLTEAASGRPLGDGDLDRWILAALGVNPDACPPVTSPSHTESSAKGTQKCPPLRSSEPDPASAALSRAAMPRRATTSS
ncbi:MAG: TetR family transcriptional regulator [Propionibacteriaceae bacterium]|nr:TetR family transcriptional regulator [Propionibacteriaceae bacterium]